MDKIIRCVTHDGSLVASVVDSSDIVYTAQELHGLTKTTGAAFGRLLTAASIMGAMLKSQKSSVTIKVNGGGPIGNLVARGDSEGNVRGYVDHPEIELPIRKTDGKIDVGGAVGNDGMLAVIRDEGKGEPYIGHVQLVSGEIAEDITNYCVRSEQIPTFCALGVLMNKDTAKVMLAGGMLIQVLPGADDSAITRVEENIAKMDSVTTMLAKGISPLDMCKIALEGFEIDVLDEFNIHYKCNCSKEKFENMLLTIGAEEIRDIPLVKDGKAETSCQYCNKKYYFDKSELEKIAQKAAQKKI